ncbi:acyltransferase [Intrasporangium sp. YIM S08009]|uniref:acyltransferase n=1 Tax=Intrasporangium zincisolvens TaxID=3080018 RepID=UPI002B05FAF5|nr:acyltransferase [Intrasporangium sp. YIM S08009]
MSTPPLGGPAELVDPPRPDDDILVGGSGRGADPVAEGARPDAETDRTPARHRPDLAWISWLRFVGIAAVVTIHTVGYNALEPRARDTLRGTTAIYLDVLGVFAVPVFVMLSGALLLDPARYQGPREFLRKRALRLLPAIVFWHAWYFLVRVLLLDQDLGVGDAAAQALSGKLYGALYFFWIVLGLAVLTPFLIPFVAQATRRQMLVVGTLGCLMTAVSQATAQWRDTPDVFIETAWTWWVPYLGYFLLGWALRGVVLRGRALVGSLVVVVALGALMPWQWRNPDAPRWLETMSPAWYYSITAMVYSAALFLLFQGLIRRDGPLHRLASPQMSSLARTLGDATMGVFALHLTILLWVFEWPVIGGERAAGSTSVLLLRIAAVLALTYVIVLLLRRVPGVKRLL